MRDALFEWFQNAMRTGARRAAAGAIAGAAGTLALDAATYADIAVRGRPPSDVPATVIEKVAARNTPALAFLLGDAPTSQHRRTGVGALSGYAIGILTGAVYALCIPPQRRRIAADGFVLAIAALALADIPTIRLGATDVRKWSPADWAADAVPHLVYGLTTAAVVMFGERGTTRQ